MKYEGEFQGINIYSNPLCPPGMMYLVSDVNFIIDFPTKKDGKPDMRYSVNKLQGIFDPSFKDSHIKK